MELKPEWEFITDGVMGGVSTGGLSREIVAGRQAMHLTGNVSTENNGGFVQMAFDLAPEGEVFDASAYHAVGLYVQGNGETYEMRLRTDELSEPWQSYRAPFEANADWREVILPFNEFEPNKTDVPLDRSRLRRVGIVAVGREFRADVAVAGVRLLPR